MLHKLETFDNLFKTTKQKKWNVSFEIFTVLLCTFYGVRRTDTSLNMKRFLPSPQAWPTFDLKMTRKYFKGCKCIHIDSFIKFWQTFLVHKINITERKQIESLLSPNLLNCGYFAIAKSRKWRKPDDQRFCQWYDWK